jgi:hypothetical protein
VRPEPIAAAALFRKVMTAAAWRCQCTGACGQPHAQSDGRCPREHGNYAGKHSGPIRLIAAPADPATTARRAAVLPAADLRAWCPTCHTTATRKTRPPAAAPEQGGLFDL